MFRHSELTANAANLILKQQSKRFAQAQIHLLGESADIVMAFYSGAGNRQRLDAVGINCSLRKPFDILNLMSFTVKDINEAFADDFALFLGIADAGKLAENFQKHQRR